MFVSTFGISFFNQLLMKKVFSIAHITLLCIGLWLWSLACSSTEQSPSEVSGRYTIATDNYIVLAEKALTYQSDFDWEGCADLLADDVQYFLPDSAQPLVGKSAVLAFWKSWPQRTRLDSWQLSHFNHIPVQTRQALPFSGLSGVYVISMFRGKLHYVDGHTRTLNLNCCLHFNAQKRIDRWYSYYDHRPMIPTLTTIQTTTF